MINTDFIEQLREELKVDPKTSIKKVYTGFFSRCYLVKTQRPIFVKKYIRNPTTHLKEWNAQENMKGEIESLQRMRLIRRKNIIIPRIRHINEESPYIAIDFIRFEKFYPLLLRRCNILRFDPALQKIFKDLGAYLAAYHNKGKERGGNHLLTDLNHKNICFSGKRVVLFDMYDQIGDPHQDVARVILNLLLLNPIYEIILSGRGLHALTQAFLDGYQAEGTLTERGLKERILQWLQEEERTNSSTSMHYQLIRAIMKLQIKRLKKRIAHFDLKRDDLGL